MFLSVGWRCSVGGSVAIKIIQRSCTFSSLSSDSRESEIRFPIRSNPSGPAGRLILLCTTADFFPYRCARAGALTGTRKLTYSARRSGMAAAAAAPGVTFCAPLTNPQIENLRSDRALISRRRLNAARLFFSARSITPTVSRKHRPSAPRQRKLFLFLSLYLSDVSCTSWFISCLINFPRLSFRAQMKRRNITHTK